MIDQALINKIRRRRESARAYREKQQKELEKFKTLWATRGMSKKQIEAATQAAGIKPLTASKTEKPAPRGDFWQLMQAHHAKHGCSWLESHKATAKAYPEIYKQYCKTGAAR
jgi:hypothetical protein